MTPPNRIFYDPPLTRKSLLTYVAVEIANKRLNLAQTNETDESKTI